MAAAKTQLERQTSDIDGTGFEYYPDADLPPFQPQAPSNFTTLEACDDSALADIIASINTILARRKKEREEAAKKTALDALAAVGLKPEDLLRKRSAKQKTSVPESGEKGAAK